MAPVYSTRFHLTQTKDAWQVWTCPANKRAVVRQVSCAMGGIAGEYVQAELNGFTIMTVPYLVNVRQAYYDVRWVLYWGDRLGFYLHPGQPGSPLAVTTSGFLFDDPYAAVRGKSEPAAPPAATPPVPLPER